MARGRSVLVACALLLAVAVLPAAAQNGTCSKACFDVTRPNYATGGGFYFADAANCDPNLSDGPFYYCLNVTSTSNCRQCKTPLTTATDPAYVLPDCPQCVLDRYPDSTVVPSTPPGSPAGSPPSGLNIDAILSCINQSDPNFQTGIGYQYYDPICYTEVSLLCVQATGCRLCEVPPSTSTKSRRLLQAPQPSVAAPECPAYICDYYGETGCLPQVGTPIVFDFTTVPASIRLTGVGGQLVPFTPARRQAFQQAIANVLGPYVSPSNVEILNVQTIASGGAADVVDVSYRVRVPTTAAPDVAKALDVTQNSAILQGQLAAAGLGLTAVGVAGSGVSGPALAPAPVVPTIQISYVTGAFQIITLTDNTTNLDPTLYSDVVAAALNLDFLYPENITLTSVAISSSNTTVTTLVANYTIVVLTENEPALLDALNNADLGALAAAFTAAGVAVTSIVPIGTITTVDTTAPAPSFGFAPAPSPGNAAFTHIANKYLIGAATTLVALIFLS
eukprot:jgi/Chlat1/1304/Chrsp118S01735